jgi:hypothetical protein
MGESPADFGAPSLAAPSARATPTESPHISNRAVQTAVNERLKPPRLSFSTDPDLGKKATFSWP